MLKNGELFCIDFGFSTFYLDENSNHFPLKCHDNILGTPKYVSYNIHNGNTPARRDDAISLGYIYISLFCRELPWDTLKNSELNDAYDVIHIMHYKNQERKNLKSWENLSYVANKIGSNFYNYLKYCYSLDYHETPNYEFFRELFAK
jgi:serine/threonine protein kinase